MADFVDGGSAQIVLLLVTARDSAGEDIAAVLEKLFRVRFNIVREVAVLRECPLAIKYLLKTPI